MTMCCSKFNFKREDSCGCRLCSCMILTNALDNLGTWSQRLRNTFQRDVQNLAIPVNASNCEQDLMSSDL